MWYLLKTPKLQLAATLILIYLSSLIQSDFTFSWYILLPCVGFTIFFDLLFTFLRKKVLFMPLSALVSGLIIGLIINPQALWHQIAVICALAMGFKNFVRISSRHIFNPAAIGLYLGGVIFNLGVSWWAVSFQDITQFKLLNIIPFLILLTPGLISCYRMRRFGSVLSFLIMYNLLSGFKILLDPTTIFFALVMLPEPMTSPFNLKKQIMYGIVVAVIASVLSYPLMANFLLNLRLLPDVLIPALLLGNLFFFK